MAIVWAALSLVTSSFLASKSLTTKRRIGLTPDGIIRGMSGQMNDAAAGRTRAMSIQGVIHLPCNSLKNPVRRIRTRYAFPRPGRSFCCGNRSDFRVLAAAARYDNTRTKAATCEPSESE